MTSTERAKETHERLADQARELFAKVDACIVSGEAIGLIFNALRSAQNDKLEEAAAHFERYSAAFSGRSFAATLRALKSKD